MDAINQWLSNLPGLSVPAGTRIGPYAVESLLGRGGMGAVYRVVHAHTGATYALKVILASRLAADRRERAMARFHREARVLARVDDHPNVVRIHATGEHEGIPWCAMAYVEGESLQQRLDDGPVAPAEAARLLAITARAMEHVHAAGVVHRDLKPANVLIDQVGQPHVVDFGLAFDELSETLTRTGEMIGTPGYMAPEQIDQALAGVQPAEVVSVRTDVYALGATLYAALTGDGPFSEAGGAMALMRAITNDLPTPPRRRVPSVPVALEAICMKALEKRPSDRYAGAGEMAADLEAFLRGDAVSARPTGRLRQQILSSRLRPRTRGGKAAGLVLALALGAAVIAGATVAFGRVFGPAPSRRLDAFTATLREQGSLSAGELEALGELAASEAVQADPALARRAELVQRTAAILAGDERSAGALAALVRHDGAVDRTLLVDAVEVLHEAGRLRALAHLLHGAPPAIAPPSPRIAADLARAMAEEDGPIPPEDDEAFRATLRAPGLDETVRGRLLVRRGEALLGRGAAGFDAALDAFVEALRAHGVPARGAAWPEAFRRRAVERILASARERTPEAADIVDVLVLAGNGPAPLPFDVVNALQEQAEISTIFSAAVGRASEKQVDDILLIAPLLEADGSWPIHGDNLGSVRETLAPARIIAAARAEMARPAARRNPARLIFLGYLLRKTDRKDEARAFLASAAESPLDEAWFHCHLARFYRYYAEWPRARRHFERALELDRRLEPKWRNPMVAERFARLLLEPRDDAPAEVERAARLAKEALDVQDAVIERLTGMTAAHCMPSWVLARERHVGQLLFMVCEKLLEEGAPSCCGRGGDEPWGVDEMVAAGVEVLERPAARISFGVESDGKGATAAALLGLRARHAESHHHLDAAIDDLTRAIAVEADRQIFNPSHEVPQLERLARLHDQRRGIYVRLGREREARFDERKAAELKRAAEARK